MGVKGLASCSPSVKVILLKNILKSYEGRSKYYIKSQVGFYFTFPFI